MPPIRSARVRPGHSGGRADAMPSAVGYGGYAPRNPSGHLSRLLAGIHADPLLLLLERLHHEPEKRSAPISSTVRVEGNWPRQRE